MNAAMSARSVFLCAGVLAFAGLSAAEPVSAETKAAAGETAKIETIDRNFQQAKIGNVEFRFINAESGAPLSLEGLPWRLQSKSGNSFRRLPDSMQGKINGGAFWLANHPSGAALRFRTDSRKIAIRGTLAWSLDMNNMPRAGSSGFDLYRGNGPEAFHCGTFQPNAKQGDFAVTIYGTGDGKMSDYILNFPLYGGVKTLEIGILPGSKLEAPTPHKVGKPILFYGSSITQGGCASRPGNMYPSQLCRAVDAPGTVVMLNDIQRRNRDKLAIEIVTPDDVSDARNLIGVTGVGPASALAILSVLSPDQLTLAIMTGDEKSITRAKGVGAKSAKRIILELKDKIGGTLDFSAGPEGAPAPAAYADGSRVALATAALAELGYSQSEAASALKGADGEHMSVEELVRYGLRAMVMK